MCEVGVCLGVGGQKGERSFQGPLTQWWRKCPTFLWGKWSLRDFLVPQVGQR